MSTQGIAQSRRPTRVLWRRPLVLQRQQEAFYAHSGISLSRRFGISQDINRLHGERLLWVAWNGEVEDARLALQLLGEMYP